MPSTHAMIEQELKRKISNRLRIRGVVLIMALLAGVGTVWFLVNGKPTTSPSNSPQSVSADMAASIEHNAYSLPSCTLEDGSEQDLCLWDDGSGDQVVNIEYGRYSYNLTQGTMHDWTNE